MNSNNNSAPNDDVEKVRRLSNQGKGLFREGYSSTDDSEKFEQENPFSPKNSFLPPPPHISVPARPVTSDRAEANSVYHEERSSSEDEEEDARAVGISGNSKEQYFEVVTTERPLRELIIPLHNPIDRGQIVPEREKTFTKESFIICHIWRDENAFENSSQSVSSFSPSSPAVDAIRRSISSSRRSLISSRRSITTAANTALGSFIDQQEEPSPQSLSKRKLSEKKLVHLTETGKETEKQIELAKQGVGSDYTLFNRDWTVLLRARRSHAHWTQLHNRHKHSDLVFYVGSLGDVPIATLKSGARASRLLLLERQCDGGIAYTLMKDKFAGYRVFWIAEGRKQNGLLEPTECRFVLVIRKGRAVVKCKGDNSLLLPHLSNSKTSLQSISHNFNTTVVDFLDKGPESLVKVVCGMDLVLAFACLAIADRFEKYSCFRPNEKVRSEILNERFETGIGDEELDVFHKTNKHDFVYGTTAGASSLMY